MDDLMVTSEWIQYARMDYGSALHLRSFHPLPIDIICYHCQQAAEKALKAVLIHHGREVPKIHDTSRLLQLAAACEPTLFPLADLADRLADFATVTRYPNELELSESDMKRALDDARMIIEAIEALWRENTDNPSSL